MTEGKHATFENRASSCWMVTGPRRVYICSAPTKHLAEIIAEALDRYRAEIDERVKA